MNKKKGIMWRIYFRKFKKLISIIKISEKKDHSLGFEVQPENISPPNGLSTNQPYKHRDTNPMHNSCMIKGQNQPPA